MWAICAYSIAYKITYIAHNYLIMWTIDYMPCYKFMYNRISLKPPGQNMVNDLVAVVLFGAAIVAACFL